MGINYLKLTYCNTLLNYSYLVSLYLGCGWKMWIFVWSGVFEYWRSSPCIKYLLFYYEKGCLYDIASNQLLFTKITIWKGWSYKICHVHNPSWNGDSRMSNLKRIPPIRDKTKWIWYTFRNAIILNILVEFFSCYNSMHWV